MTLPLVPYSASTSSSFLASCWYSSGLVTSPPTRVMQEARTSQLSGSNGSEADPVAGIRDKAAHAFGQVRPEPVLRPIGTIDADDREMVRNAAGAHEIVERRHQQPPRQVAAGAEDHHRAGRRAMPALRPLGCVVEAVIHAVISFGAVILAALPGGRRIPCASPTGSFRRRCGPAATGTAYRAPPTARRPERPARSPPGSSSDPRPKSATLPVNSFSSGSSAKRDRGQVQQPGRHDAAAPPDLGDIGEIELDSGGSPARRAN